MMCRGVHPTPVFLIAHVIRLNQSTTVQYGIFSLQRQHGVDKDLYFTNWASNPLCVHNSVMTPLRPFLLDQRFIPDKYKY